MQAHPSISLEHVLPKYPRAAGSLFQAYNDILLVQQWTDVKVVDLEAVSRAAITGKKPNTDVTLHVTLSFAWLKTAFTQLSDPPEIYLAITSDDASIVYYKISRGIIKPQV
ncbi:tRNA intron endonuclease [Mycena leptocephala]|nr:tRNA intron endonuclease [Mycena leptocephala]